MNALQRQYLFGLLFFGVGAYYISLSSWLESSLYIVAGLAFISNALTLDPRFAAYKKPLAIVSWVLIIAAGLLFLYLAQFYWF